MGKKHGTNPDTWQIAEEGHHRIEVKRKIEKRVMKRERERDRQTDRQTEHLKV